jgi:hypothetical protein
VRIRVSILTMIDKYKRGKRVYTHWDKKTEQVTIVKQKKALPVETRSEIEVNNPLAGGAAANLFIIHSSRDEFVIDFGFASPNSSKAKISSRIILSPGTVKKFALALKKSLDETI